MIVLMQKQQTFYNSASTYETRREGWVDVPMPPQVKSIEDAKDYYASHGELGVYRGVIAIALNSCPQSECFTFEVKEVEHKREFETIDI